ncbi:hypothetical protein AB0D49_05410 [Streptomyces sp. NPDC048290]|uniref:hypothetical protein n=1 Tax=Streptomyces sp. NPDC048290 TaxID=3155811 RepID=UPI00343B085E
MTRRTYRGSFAGRGRSSQPRRPGVHSWPVHRIGVTPADGATGASFTDPVEADDGTEVTSTFTSGQPVDFVKVNWFRFGR